MSGENRARTLSSLATCGGCAAKVAPADLQKIMGQARAGAAPRPAELLVGTETGDDAAVYSLDDERALVLTTDFITPVCDDPYLYGQVAAANALSDVFAMGGRPLVALAVCAFPEELASDDAAAICRGGADKAAEAGAIVAGGHSVRNPQLFYGLAVTGLVRPVAVVRNVGAQPADALVLTKPLGTGTLINGYRSGKVSEPALLATCRAMAILNDRASRLMLEHEVHAATDVTGFGLAGHGLGMARGSGVGFRLDASDLPVYDGALALIEAGVTSRGGISNRETFRAEVEGVSGGGPIAARELLLYDPQTSGGLLCALPAARSAAFVAALHREGLGQAAVIGQVTAARPGAPHLQLR
jgi:selenide,water dikinase